MRVVLVDPLPGFLEERQRLGLDRRDEVWDGVRHVPPLPSMDHQRLAGRVLEALAPLARTRGLEVLPWPNLLDPARGFEQYRVPDLVVVEPRHTTNRGVEGPAALVVELLSPRDESRAKLPFYASRGVQEVWLIDPIARTVEQYLLRGETYFTTVPDRDGTLRSTLFDLELRTIDGPRLQLAWPGGSVAL